eukprot:m.372247 g.372247  ORF g.372247 m.372247 type:complete len:83 (-) comp20869_c1_seq3:90-338(-)
MHAAIDATAGGHMLMRFGISGARSNGSISARQNKYHVRQRSTLPGYKGIEREIKRQSKLSGTTTWLATECAACAHLSTHANI